MLLENHHKVNPKVYTGQGHGRGCPLFKGWLRIVLITLVAVLLHRQLYAEDFFSYLKQVHRQAVDLKLYEDRTWLYLLHYYPVESGSESDITDGRFFLSADGNRDPKAELYETLEAIFDPVFEKSNRHGQCLFRSRFFWLDRQLKFDRKYLPRVNCRNYNNWRRLVGAQSISLVFASAFMDNPGSVYGHTFLKINHEKGGRRLNLLDHVIQYQALPEEQVGLLYAIKGIFGGYRGLYPLDPYYIPIQNNIEYEDRSIWEYELNLTDYQMEILLTHSWELAHFYTDYYFFKQNCAYRILELIEIATPQHRFKDRFPVWAMPSQAVVYALNEEGLVRQMNYFPARTRQLMQKFESLDADEKALMNELVQDLELLQSDSFNRLPEERRIRILDTALDFLRSRVNKKRDDPENKQLRRQILLARSRLGKSPQYLDSLPEEQSIHLGHAPARIQAGIGSRDSRNFMEIGFRPTYHDLLADETGHLANSHFTTFDFKFRIYEDDWVLHQLEIVQLFDLAANNIISDDWSWRLTVGLFPSTADSCIYCRKSQVQMAFGKSRTLFSRAGSGYLMVHGSLEGDDAYEKDYLLGGGMDAGLLFQMSDSWKMHLELSATRGVVGDDHGYLTGNLRNRWKLSQHRDLRLNWNWQSEHEVMLAMNWYF